MSRRRTPEELLERQTPRGLVTHACEYFMAAEIVATAVGFGDDHGGLKRPGLTHPYYYLAGHSIELSLKAMLLANGHTHAQLQNFGHDLTKVWTLARALSTDKPHRNLFDAYKNDLKLLNVHYQAKDLEYRVTGHFSLPRARVILEAAREFFEAANVIVSRTEKSR
jgi:hypothetical protein